MHACRERSEGRRRQSKWCGLLSQGRVLCWVLCLEAFIFLAGRNLWGGFIISSGVPFLGHGLLWLVSARASVFSHCSWFWHHPPGFAAFLGLDLKHNRGLDVVSKKEMPGAERLPWGQGPVFPVLLPPWWPSAPGWKLLSHCAQLSQFPYSTCQGIFLASHYPVASTSALSFGLPPLHMPSP